MQKLPRAHFNTHPNRSALTTFVRSSAETSAAFYAHLDQSDATMERKMDHVYDSLMQHREAKAKIRHSPSQHGIHPQTKVQLSGTLCMPFHPVTECNVQNLPGRKIENTALQTPDKANTFLSPLERVGSEKVADETNRENKVSKYLEYQSLPNSGADVANSGQLFQPAAWNSSSQDATIAPDISGSRVAHLFAEQAAKNLSTGELHSLLQFFANTSPRHDEERVEKQILAKLEEFYTAETKLTKEPRTRLAKPSGRACADLGLIMHCQSKDGDIGEFWDVESRSIQPLAKKGVNPGVIFGYDWHWRAEGLARLRNSNCPATKWSKGKRDLHNAFSHEILNILPLPLLIIAGACAKKQYQGRLLPATRRLTVTPLLGIDIIYDLDFQHEGLKRITTYVDHPSASFFKPNGAAEVCVRLDAALNFFLWLLGMKHEERTFTERQAEHRRGVPRSAPLAELHDYNKRERNLGRNLLHHEYDQAFLSWAHQYLDDDVSALLGRGESVAQALRQKIDSKISARFYEPNRVLRHATANRQKNAQRYGYEFKEYWDGHEVKVHRNGYVRLYMSAAEPALKFRTPKRVFAACEESGIPAVIEFSEEGLALFLGSRKVFSRSRQSQTGSGAQAKEWEQQFDKELRQSRRGCILQEEQDIDHSRVPGEESKEQAKTQSKASNDRSDYYKAYYEANKEEIQAKNRAYCERNKADLNEKAKIRMRALRQHRKNALQRDATMADGPDVEE